MTHAAIAIQTPATRSGWGHGRTARPRWSGYWRPTPEPSARRPADARRLAERIVVSTGRAAAAVDALAACHAALGWFEEAVRLASEAESATPANPPALRGAIRERMTLYRAGKAFTLTPL